MTDSRLMDYQVPDKLLEGRNLVVTGASDGIGKAVAVACASAGANVTLLGRSKKKLEATYDLIEQAGGPRAAICPFDFRTATLEDYISLAEGLSAEYPHLHGLVNNASILGPRTPIGQYPPDKWIEVMHINVNAQFLLTQHCLPLLNAAPDASVVFVSSGVGRTGRAYWGAYCVSKFAVEGLSQILADEVANNTKIRVNTLNPGRTRTEMRRAAYPAEDPRTLPTPQQIAPAYLYLLGNDSSNVHGQSLDAQ